MAWQLTRRPSVAGPGRQLGATPTTAGRNFALWAAAARRSSCACSTTPGTRRGSRCRERTYDVWHGYLPRRRAGPALRLPRARAVGPARAATASTRPSCSLDPYARAIDGELRLDDAGLRPRRRRRRHRMRDDRDSAPYVPRSVVVARRFDWGDDRRAARRRGRTPSSTSCTCAGFTTRHPDVPPQLRGTYAGLAHPAVVEHLRRLGVTAVELLPVHQFVSRAAPARAAA